MDKSQKALDLTEYMDDWSEVDESLARTTRFYHKHQNSDDEEQFDPERSIRISTRIVSWHGETIDQGGSPGMRSDSEFEILHPLGGGGMGMVYSARQRSVDREVALKMISPELAVDPESRESFLREAVVTGNLSHPNIVAVHDLGRSGTGSLFYTMQKIVGISWDRVLKRRSETENLEILLKVCDAVAYAHSKGVVHRDLKPANIMLGNFGEVMVTDWGVAVGAGDFELSRKAIRLTKDSDIEGTPAYMPPEMLDPEVHRIGPRSDIYLLGGILYEIVTGLRPHKINATNMIHTIRFNIIQASDLTGELIEIARKAMATEPDGRYESVKDFQTAIRNYQIHRESIRLTQSADENFDAATVSGDYQLYAKAMYGYQEALRLWQDNIKARNSLRMLVSGYAERAYANGDFDLALSVIGADRDRHSQLFGRIQAAQKERRRRQLKLRLTYLGLIGTGVALIAVLTVSCILIGQSRNRALTEEARARRLLTQKERENYYSLIALAANNLRLMNFRQAASILDQAPESLRSLEWHLLRVLARPLRAELRGHTDSVAAVAYSPDGRYLVSGGRDGQVRVRDNSSGRYIHNFNFMVPVQRVKCSPDSRIALVVRSDRYLSLIHLESGEVFRTISSSAASVSAADFLPDGRRIVFGSGDGTITVFDIFSGEVIREFPGHKGVVSAICCSPDGRHIVTAGWDLYLKVWDLNREQPRPLREIRAHRKYIDALAIAPRSGVIASGGGDNIVNLWNLNTGDKIAAISNLPDAVNAISFSPDEQEMLAASGNRITVYNRHNLVPVKTFELDSGVIAYCAAFSPDGRTVAAGDGSNVVTLWDAAGLLDGTVEAAEQNESDLMAESSVTGARVYAMPDHRLEVRFPDGRTSVLIGHEGKVNAAIFLGMSGRIATCSNDTTVRVWNAANGVMLRLMRGHKRYVAALAATPDGSRLASASWDGVVKIWDVSANRELLSIAAGEEPITDTAFSSDGKLLLTAASDGIARLWRVDDGVMLHSFTGHTAQINAITFSPDNRRALTISEDQTMRIWDIGTGRELVSFNTKIISGGHFSFVDGDRRLELHSPARNLAWNLTP